MFAMMNLPLQRLLASGQAHKNFSMSTIVLNLKEKEKDEAPKAPEPDSCWAQRLCQLSFQIWKFEFGIFGLDSPLEGSSRSQKSNVAVYCRDNICDNPEKMSTVISLSKTRNRIWLSSSAGYTFSSAESDVPPCDEDGTLVRFSDYEQRGDLSGAPKSICFGPLGDRFLIGDSKGRVTSVLLHQNRISTMLRDELDITALAMLPSGEALVACGPFIELVRLNGTVSKAPLKRHKHKITTVALRQHSSTCITVSSDAVLFCLRSTFSEIFGRSLFGNIIQRGLCWRSSQETSLHAVLVIFF